MKQQLQEITGKVKLHQQFAGSPLCNALAKTFWEGCSNSWSAVPLNAPETFSYTLHKQIATYKDDIICSITQLSDIILMLVQDLKSVKSSGTKKICTSSKNNI